MRCGNVHVPHCARIRVWCLLCLRPCAVCKLTPDDATAIASALSRAEGLNKFVCYRTLELALCVVTCA